MGEKEGNPVASLQMYRDGKTENENHKELEVLSKIFFITLAWERSE